MSETRGGQEKPPRAQGQGRRPGGATRGAVAARGHAGWPTRSYPTLKVRKDSGKEMPLIQGNEQQLCFAGAPVKRYPTPKVRETQVRW